MQFILTGYDAKDNTAIDRRMAVRGDPLGNVKIENFKLAQI